MIRHATAAALLAAALAAAPLGAGAKAEDIRIAHVYGKTGALEAYAKQSHIGFMMGLEYATEGTMEIDGRKIVVIEKDTQLKPDIGRAALAEAYGDDDVHLAVGPVSSGVALAMLPVAEEYGKLLLVEPAVADSITGENWNRYVFRTGRNSSQDAIANAVALGKDGVTIATLAQDYAFGRDGVAAFREALADTGAKLAFEEYAPTDTQDFTASAQRIFDAMKDIEGRKFLFVIWAGANNPIGKIKAMEPERFGIEIATGGKHPGGDEGLQGAAGHGRRHLLLPRHPEEPGERLAGLRAPEAPRLAAGLLHRRRHVGRHRRRRGHPQGGGRPTRKT